MTGGHRRKRFVIVVYFKIDPQIDNRLKASALLCAAHKVSEIPNLPKPKSTTIYAIKKRMDDDESISTDVQAVVERLFCRAWQDCSICKIVELIKPAV